MAGKFSFKKFSEIDLSDPFFDSLKEDYPADENNPGFVRWFTRKASAGSTALVFDDDKGLGAFVCLKDEDEAIQLTEGYLPAIPRKKISTLLLAERYRGQRLGEGAIGLALWNWQKSESEEIYITVFEKHKLLIEQLVRYGFIFTGYNLNGECVYTRSRLSVDYSDPYKAFPFLNPAFNKAGYLIVNDVYHDTLFPYSELSRTLQESVGLSVANGLCKIYVGAQYSRPHYQVGEPILIYRRYTKQDGQKPKYKSCVTSYCVVNDVIMVKTNNKPSMTYEQLKSRIGNKTIFDENEIKEKYNNNRNMIVVEMLYYGFFGAGNNVNNAWLCENGYWAGDNEYPTKVRLTPEQFKRILIQGNVNVKNVFLDTYDEVK